MLHVCSTIDSIVMHELYKPFNYVYNTPIYIYTHAQYTHTHTHTIHLTYLYNYFLWAPCRTLNKNNNNKQHSKSLLPATRDESSADSGDDDVEEEEEEEEAEHLEQARAADQSNCLHCGEQHNDAEETEPESVADNGTDQQLTLSENAQTCDILDHNLYLRRMFVMPNSFLTPPIHTYTYSNREQLLE